MSYGLKGRTAGWVGIPVNAMGVTGLTGPFHEIEDEAWLGAMQKEERPTLELQRRGEAEEVAAA